jgi:hypothetical protein
MSSRLSVQGYYSWVIERTFGWLNRYRHLSKDYESLPATSDFMIRVTMIHLRQVLEEGLQHVHQIHDRRIGICRGSQMVN